MILLSRPSRSKGIALKFHEWSRLAAVVTMVFALPVGFGDGALADEATADTRPALAADIRDDETALKLQKGNFVAVPIPISDPTLGTGLVAGSAYFYAQTEEQEKSQPASATAIAGMYTNNDSRALAIAQQSYWNQDRWRFTGAIGAADLRLSLLAPTEDAALEKLDWRVDGAFLLARLSRNLFGNWYGGGFTRMIDANQSLEFEAGSVDFDTSDVRSVGVGLTLEYDSRDMPINSYAGRYFKVEGLFNDEAIGSNETYQSYEAEFRAYHQWTETVVVAWELHACQRVGRVPLWDSCTIGLRGFPATNYLGKSSYLGQAEARWWLSRRWGLVAFGGAGEIGTSFTGYRNRDTIPSYGVGVRFSVLPAKRVNVRLDLARSKDDDAIHLSVGEAF